jgi:hypothetical protein
MTHGLPTSSAAQWGMNAGVESFTC